MIDLFKMTDQEVYDLIRLEYLRTVLEDRGEAAAKAEDAELFQTKEGIDE